MSLQSVGKLSFDFLASRPVEIEISDSPLTSDAGLLPIAQFDERIGLTPQFAAALKDLRDPAFVRHSMLSMVRQPVFGIMADYEDQNDHDTLRSDPVFKLLAGRLPNGEDLASQPTLSRFENDVSISDPWRLRDVLVDQFIESFEQPPRLLTLDVDAFDDPAHGQQQLTFFHGYYGNQQYLPIVFTCAENDAVLLIGLRHGTCAAALAAPRGLPAGQPNDSRAACGIRARRLDRSDHRVTRTRHHRTTLLGWGVVRLPLQAVIMCVYPCSSLADRRRSMNNPS